MSLDSSFYGALAGVSLAATIALFFMKQLISFLFNRFLKQIQDALDMLQEHDKKIAILEKEVYGKQKCNSSAGKGQMRQIEDQMGTA